MKRKASDVIFISTISASLLWVPITANADTTDSALTIAHVGTQQGGFAYVQIPNGLSLTCPFNAVYIDVLSDSGKAMYSTALTAKVSNTPINRLTYQIKDGVCQASLLEI